MLQSWGEIRTESIHWEGNVKWELPPRRTAPCRVGAGASWGGQGAGMNGAARGQCGLGAPLLGASRAAPQSTSLRLHIASRWFPPAMQAFMPVLYRDSQICSQAGLPSWAPQCSLTKAPAHRHLPVSKSKCSVFSPRPAPLPVSSASGNGQLHLLGCSARCSESGEPRTLPMCCPSPKPLPPLIIGHLATAEAPRPAPLLAPHTHPAWRQSRPQLRSGSARAFLHHCASCRNTHGGGQVQTSLQGPRSCFLWFQIQTHEWDCRSIQGWYF